MFLRTTKLVSGAVTAAVVLAGARLAIATQVTWGAYETDGLGLANGAQLAVGSLVRIGSFTIPNTDIVAHAHDVTYLNAHFLEFATAHIGDGDVNGDANSYPAHWLANATASVTRVTGTQIYYWVFDSTTVASATQMGVFTAAGNARWVFPDDSDIPNTAVTDISDVPHNSAGYVIGGYGVSSSSLSGQPLFNLAPVVAQQPTPSPSPAPSASVSPMPLPTSSPTSTPSPTPTATPTPTASASATPPLPSQLLNLSTREQVGVDDNVLIGGFIIGGTDGKKVLLRGLGPSLPVSGALANPTLELHDAAESTIAFDDNWRDNQQDEIIATGIPPTNDLESAIVATLPASPLSDGGAAYTAVLAGESRTTGIGLLELYDLDISANSKFANISTRGFVGADPRPLIGGFIPGPADRASATVLIRALGPSLTKRGVSGALQDPVLELHDANGNTLVTNDNWQDAPNAAEIRATLPPTDDHESAILISLAPANSGYTAIVRGVNSSVGVALVEIYALP